MNLYGKVNWTEEEKGKINNLQSKLDEMYLYRAKAAYLRSKAKWIEEGEKNTAYFCNLETRRQEYNSICNLIIDGEECTDPKRISNEVFTFYSNLYKSSYSEQNVTSFFDKISNWIPVIDDNFRKICDEDLTIEEFDFAIKSMASDRSPGPDGITTNFYKHFWEDLKLLLFSAINECINQKELMTTMKQGVIKLIPKPGKDKKKLSNLRPITLLNTDYKVFTKVLATRLKTGISEIISPTQSGFLKGRLIQNNIRLVLDLIDYNYLIKDDGFMLFLDFHKAFDSIEHSFIIKTFKHFGFGDAFLDMITMFYTDINSCVSLLEGTCPRFRVERGIRQGCSISPLLFIVATELLAITVINSNIKGLDINNHKLIISQLADDTTVFLKNKEQIPLALDTIKIFSDASGLRLNLDKCELMSIHNCSHSSLYDIPVKNEIKYLGIWITKCMADSEEKNIQNTIDKCKKTLNHWLQRDLTLFGRIMLTKVESLSRFIYPAYSLAIPPRIIKDINKVNFNFIWKNKHHYVSNRDLIKDYEEGGLKAIDFEIMNGILKINWLRSFLKNDNDIWFLIPSLIFNKVGGIQLLLVCDFEISKLPIKLSKFHQQVLLNWKLMFKHNFSPHNVPLWNNRVILNRGKSMFVEEWMTKQIWSVTHIIDENGDILELNRLNEKYNMSCSLELYKKVSQNIPTVLVNTVKNNFSNMQTPNLHKIKLDGLDLVDGKCNNQFLRKYLINTLYPGRTKHSLIFRDYNKSEISLIRTKYLTFPIPPKFKEVHFRTTKNIYPSNEFMRDRFKFVLDNCYICKTTSETTEHMFYGCVTIQNLWKSLHVLILSQYGYIDFWSFQNIQIGVILMDKNSEFLVNNLIIITKYYIHKC
uniref:Reverse transcriptase domain-containing protein n=1 Tax=Nothobranchius furzeri TaxID=105023 RepID=A0A8C6K9W5_NOTFU